MGCLGVQKFWAEADANATATAKTVRQAVVEAKAPSPGMFPLILAVLLIGIGITPYYIIPMKDCGYKGNISISTLNHPKP